MNFMPALRKNLLKGIGLLAAAPFSRTARARLRHPLLYRLLRAGSPLTHHQYHARIAASYLRGKPGRVLVVGCNTGLECRVFTELGAEQVDGLDLIEKIGTGFTHDRVSYLRVSAEKMGIRDDTYDLVYCYATMEHIADIAAAFAECVRVTRPSGVIYSVAAPLWCSRFGHHKSDIFPRHPWVHLRLDEEQILALSKREGIVDPTGRREVAFHVRYMMNPAFFNRVRASRYVEVCRNLAHVKILVNDLNLEPESVLPDDLYRELERKGYSHQDLLALGHTFVARRLSAS